MIDISLSLVLGQEAGPDGFWAALAEGKNLFWVLAAGVGVVAVIAHYTRSTMVARAREKTNREIFAYVASGSIEPDQATDMLKAAREADKQECNIGED